MAHSALGRLTPSYRSHSRSLPLVVRAMRPKPRVALIARRLMIHRPQASRWCVRADHVAKTH
jgi:hypothetical protein